MERMLPRRWDTIIALLGSSDLPSAWSNDCGKWLRMQTRACLLRVSRCERSLLFLSAARACSPLQKATERLPPRVSYRPNKASHLRGSFINSKLAIIPPPASPIYHTSTHQNTKLLEVYSHGGAQSHATKTPPNRPRRRPLLSLALIPLSLQNRCYCLRPPLLPCTAPTPSASACRGLPL